MLKIKNINVNHSFSAVYCIVNMVNRKKYVGQTKNLYRRFSLFKSLICNKHLLREIKKYGFNNFGVIILKRNLAYDELVENERFWINDFNCVKDGYNIRSNVSSLPKISLQEKFEEGILLSSNPFNLKSVKFYYHEDFLSIEKEEFVKVFLNLMNELRKNNLRLYIVIYERYWENQTLEQIGKKINLTRERVRQLEEKAMEHLKSQLKKYI